MLDRQQFVDLRIQTGGEFFEGGLEPGGWLNVVELGCCQQALNCSRTLACAFAAGEQPVLLAQGYRPNGVFYRVIVDRKIACFGVARK